MFKMFSGKVKQQEALIRAIHELTNAVSTMNERLGQSAQPEPVEKALEASKGRTAAMCLNLCATSISKILYQQDMATMETEYDAILNNLNMEKVVKDEALLGTMRSILDVISFYRLQEGDKAQAMAKYKYKQKNAIWNVLSGPVFIAGGDPWTAAASAVMMVGLSVVNVRRSKAEAKMGFDDEMWKLERAALEQLHALRVSLFETAWRLADTYDFPDEWRLSVKQIDEYNRILFDTSANAAWRYAKLKQYAEFFEAYPHYWFELGEAAFSASLQQEDQNALYLTEAEEAFRSFLRINEGNQLLRQDIIASSAKLRLVHILFKKHGSWHQAIEESEDCLSNLHRLACEAPDLLQAASVCYAGAFAESKNTGYAEKAAYLLNMLVNQGYDCPISSRLLSLLYLDMGNQAEYEMLKGRVGENGVFPEEKEAREYLPSKEAQEAIELSKSLLARQVDVAMKTACPELFNCSSEESVERITEFLKKDKTKMAKSIQTMFLDLWERIQVEINSQLQVALDCYHFEPEELGSAAKSMDAQIRSEIDKYGTSEGWFGKKLIDQADKLTSNKNLLISKQDDFERFTDLIRDEYVDKLGEVLRKQQESFADDVNKAAEAENSNRLLNTRIQTIAARRGLFVGDDSSDSGIVDFFSAATGHDDILGLSDLSRVHSYIKNKKSFTITKIPLTKIVQTVNQLRRDIKQAKYSMRAKIFGSPLLFVVAPTLIAHIEAANILTSYDPDYKVLIYATGKIKVKYMRRDGGR